jgi:hypothetical protein
MIMKDPNFRYNSKNNIKISILKTLQAYLTPVEGPPGTCHRPVDIFIHNFIHSFSYPIPPGFSTGSYSPRRCVAQSHVTP